MGINVVWKTESGDEVGRVDDPGMILSHLGEALDAGSTTCLRFIDPYGDAIFNQAQLPTLIRELEWAASTVHEPQLRSHLSAVCALAKRAHGVHTYLWFVGD
jgi:hypothetical protein